MHAADLTVIGKQRTSCRVLAVLAEELDERVVYFTWDAPLAGARGPDA